MSLTCLRARALRRRDAVVPVVVLHILLLWCGVTPSLAQTPAEPSGAIEGTVSTQSGTVRLPGAVIVVRSAANEELSEEVADGDGHFRIAELPPGLYKVSASLDGFDTFEASAVVAPGGLATLSLDLRIAAVSEQVDVVAQAVVSTSGSLTTTQTVQATEVQLISPGEGFKSAVRLMPGVIELSGGQSIDGGRPNQASVQLGSATLVDPATNLARVELPASGIDAVSVLPNPYEAEFGRFSSGLILIQTKRASNQWKIHLSDLEPALRLKRYTLLHVTGVTNWKPSVEFGGPLVRDKLFLEQTAQYHYQTTDIPSRPETELRTNKWVSSFTRLDANVSPHHSLVLAGGVVPSTVDNATLGTFTPPAATPNISDRIGYSMFTERTVVSNATVLETTLQVHAYDTTVRAQGNAPEELLPETTLGNFFNRQDRATTTLQWIEAVSSSRKGPGGQHLIKAGFDAMHSDYTGTSVSGPVYIERSNGTLARKLEYSGSTEQAVHVTDFAVFAQDRLQPTARSYIEFGGRIDRDGVTGSVGASPRVGAAVLFNASGTRVLRGGYGVFFERTPSIAGAFGQFESALDTRYADDGVTPLGPSVLYRHLTAPDLQAARSATWDVAYDNRLNRRLTLHFGVLSREGHQQLIVDPAGENERGAVVLSSNGESRYLQEEADLHVTFGSRLDLNASYVHSTAREDLNALINFFDVVMNPIIGANAYAPAPSDAPHRLLVRGQLRPTNRWLLVGTLDWRTGLPYSVVDETLDFVGPRNIQRLPTYLRLDAGFDRHVSFAKLHPWLGFRVANALNAFLPSDVQANLGSPAFGSLYNSVYREYRIHVLFEK